MTAVAMPAAKAAPSSNWKAPGALRRAAAQKAAGPTVHVHVNMGAAPKAKATPKAAAPKPGKAPAKPGGPAAFNPSAGFLSGQQLGQLANSITKQNMQAQLQPLRQQASEIGNTEQTVSNRYSGMSNATNSLLQGIGQDAGNSAKTYENEAADAALRAGQAIGQGAQTAASQTAGYLDPQVQAELAAQGKLAGSVGGAGNQLAANMGQNETNLMGNLRAAAAQRALEGQGSINTLYGGQLAKNEGQQQALIEKQPADSKSLAAELGQKQFTDYATLQGLGIKQQSATTTARNDEARNHLTERGQNLTASEKAAALRVDERKVAETERHNRASEKTAAERAQAAVKKAQGGLTTPEQDKMTGQIGTAYNVVQQLRTGKVTPQEIRNALTTGNLQRVQTVQSATGKKSEKTVTYHYPKIDNQTLVTAAFELWDYHKVSAGTVKALQGLGITVPGEWTNGSFKGF